MQAEITTTESTTKTASRSSNSSAEERAASSLLPVEPAATCKAGSTLTEDGDFEDTIDGVSEQIITNALLDPDANSLAFSIPSVIGASTVYARFRYGEFGLGPKGLAQIGEVEDYVLEVAPPIVAANIDADFDRDGDVDGADFLSWQRGFGIQTNALAGNGDANESGSVDAEDLTHVLAALGQTSSTVAAVQDSGGSAESSGAFAALAAPANYEANYGEEDAALLALDYRLVQPGFREDVVADPVSDSNASDGNASDTDTSGNDTSGNDLASIASVVQRRAFAPARKVATPTVSEPTSQEQFVKQVDQGFSARELAYAKRQENKEALAIRRADEASEKAALAVALSEDTDWRLG